MVCSTGLNTKYLPAFLLAKVIQICIIALVICIIIFIYFIICIYVWQVSFRTVWLQWKGGM